MPGKILSYHINRYKSCESVRNISKDRPERRSV
jgi:hypothetical protein